MDLETKRLVLRPRRESDATDLYEYAKDSRVGPVAGWPPHQSVDESLDVIRTIFMQEGVYAMTLKGGDAAIGCIGIVRGAKSNFPLGEDEAEISYWLGVPFWGKGLMTEAVNEVVRHGFEDMGLSTLWCGYFDGNDRSWHVQKKCGFRHHRTEPPKHFDLIDETLTEHISRLTREEWQGRQGSQSL